jgi:deoxyribose-phosphate aldolase
MICEIVLESGADFIKTSTGFAGAGATVEDIRLFKEIIGDKSLKIKASGGIRNLKDAYAMIEAGAERIGTSAGVAIMEAMSDQQSCSKFCKRDDNIDLCLYWSDFSNFCEKNKQYGCKYR